MPKATDTTTEAPASPAPAAAAPAVPPAPRPNATEVFRQPPKVLNPNRAQPGQRNRGVQPKPAAAPAPKPAPCPPGEKRAVELHQAFKGTPDWQFRATQARFRWPVGAELTELDYDKAVSDTINARFA